VPVCKRCDLDKPPKSFEKLSGGRLRGTCYRCRLGKPPEGAVIEGSEPPPKRFFRPLAGQRFIITSAQNATPVHALFLETLKVAAEHLKAEIVVIPLRYKNPTSVFTDEDHDWWDPAVEPYLYNARKKLCPNLVLVGDVKIQPTASSPLSGFESLTGGESCILGHPKMQFRTVAVPSGRYPKILVTTGTCTERNYTDSKSGKIGAFHHFLGGLVVEVDGPEFFIREINADRLDGSFTDAEFHYTPGAVFDAPDAEAINTGDTHVRVTDPDVDAATFGPGGIVPTLRPRRWFVHDLNDGESVNPHDAGDPFISEGKRLAGRQDIRAELQDAADFVNARADSFEEVIVVKSNHDDFLRRWVIKQFNNGITDLKNARLFCQTADMMLASARAVAGGFEYDDPFPWWLRRLGVKANVRCLKANESCVVAGVENGEHGHNGPGGSRGTIKNLSRLGTKMNTAHTHRPGIEEGNYQAGTSSFRNLAYQNGPNASLNAHIITYASEKRSLFVIIGRRWRPA
jgi:hypothetical protein